MQQPRTIVLDVELSNRVPDSGNLHPYAEAQVLCRLQGRPVGFVRVPVQSGRLSARALVRQLVEKHPDTLATALAHRAIVTRSVPHGVDADGLLQPAAPSRLDGPLVTVAVCTRDRPDYLRPCLDALVNLDYQNLDVLVVDNAPSSDETKELVASYPQVRYVREPRPGLDWARNRAIVECRGDILAFTDDDVIVDAQWVSAVVRVFLADAEVMAVTGLVIAHELDTSSQRLFEAYGGFGRGFLRRWYRAPCGLPAASEHAGTGRLGTGANMSFRRRVFDEIGGFDPALDVGTPTNGGGDLEMFFRVLKQGHTFVYEPAAIVRHRHRRTYEELRSQIAGNGVGFYAYLVRSAKVYPDERRALARFGAWWFAWWSIRRLVRALVRREAVPLDLILAELAGSVRGLRRYPRSLRQARATSRLYAGEPTFARAAPAGVPRARRLPEAVRDVDISTGLQPISDATLYERLHLVVSWGSTRLGSVKVEHHGAVVSALWLGDVIAQGLRAEILDLRTQLGPSVLKANVTASIAGVLMARHSREIGENDRHVPLAPDVPVTIVLATRDRPDDLARCLERLVAQRTTRPVEILVVDNHPDSRLTQPVVERFPAVRLLDEPRHGLSYARNRGIAEAAGEIIVSIDDDVICPQDWIENLVAPFSRSDVMVVTGNVLPLELETEAQRLFELYGGLGRGFVPRTFTADWFRTGRRAVPTWQIGAGANAAFRASIFADREIGMMDEALGAGTPTGCSEDTYVFYRVLKAGYTIVYEPRATVRHRHRETMAALRRQIYAYSRGHVAYHLTTWLRDGDVRGLVRIAYELPRIHASRLYQSLRGWSDYPAALIGLEILGNLTGPYALWRARRIVRRLGRSAPRQSGPRRAAQSAPADKIAQSA